MNTVTVICEDKNNRRRVYSSFGAALDAIRAWVVLGEVERGYLDFIFGK